MKNWKVLEFRFYHQMEYSPLTKRQTSAAFLQGCLKLRQNPSISGFQGNFYSYLEYFFCHLYVPFLLKFGLLAGAFLVNWRMIVLPSLVASFRIVSNLVVGSLYLTVIFQLLFSSYRHYWFISFRLLLYTSGPVISNYSKL